MTTLECLFVRDAFPAVERDAIAARIGRARDLVADWLRAAGLDPPALAIAEPAVAVVYRLGPASHVDYGDGRLYLAWPPDREPPLVHEWIHAFSPPPAGTPGEGHLREGVATHLQSLLSDDPVAPFGRARPAELLARWGPPWPPLRSALDAPFEELGPGLRFRAYALGAVLVERALRTVSPRTLFLEVLGHPAALLRLESALGRDAGEVLAEPLPAPAGPASGWFADWSAPWGASIR